MQSNLKDLPNDGQWLFANQHAGEYQPEGIINLDHLDNLEYIDVRNSEYQLWHWPSGDIYKISSDREVKPKDEYATPYGDKGIIWLPILIKVGSDKEKVADVMRKYSNQQW